MRFSCDCDSESQSQENPKSHLHCCDYISPANAISFSFNIDISSACKKEKSKVAQPQHSSHLHYAIFLRLRTKSLRLIRTSYNFSPRFRNRKYMRFPLLHYAIFLRLRFQIAIARKSHSVNGALPTDFHQSMFKVYGNTLSSIANEPNFNFFLQIHRQNFENNEKSEM